MVLILIHLFNQDQWLGQLGSTRPEAKGLGGFTFHGCPRPSLQAPYNSRPPETPGRVGRVGRVLTLIDLFNQDQWLGQLGSARPEAKGLG